MLIRTTPFWHLLARSLPLAPEGEGGSGGDAAASEAEEGAADDAGEGEGADEGGETDGTEEQDTQQSEGDAGGEESEGEEADDGVPATPADYDLSLEAIDLSDVEGLPDDYQVELDPEDPAIQELTAFAHENRMSQEAVSGLLGIAARMFARETASDQQFHAAEKQKLGRNADKRVANVRTAIENRIKDPEVRKALAGVLVSADAVKGVEALLSGQRTRTTTKNSGPDLEKMRPFEKLKLFRSRQGTA